MNAAPARYEGFVPGRHPIDAYGAGGFKFAGMGHVGSILATPRGIAAIDAKTLGEITDATLAPLFDEMAGAPGSIEFIVVGTGERMALLPPLLSRRLRTAGLRVEVDGDGIGRARLQRHARRKSPRRRALAGRAVTAPPSGELLSEAYAHCESLARAHDRDRWLSALFAPTAARPHLHALSAFNYEVGRLREIVREPLAGELRLTWWRDALCARRRLGASRRDGSARHDREVQPAHGLVREPYRGAPVRSLRRSHAHPERSRGLLRRDRARRCFNWPR